jgi:hypothetical protein
MFMMCPACKLFVPCYPADLNMPDEARCKRNHSTIADCPYETPKEKCRGHWVLDVFKPLPPEEAKALSDYLG